jgi:hypothetical protein
VTSAALPAPNITVISIGLPPGNCCASTGVAALASSSTTAALTSFLRMIVRIVSLHFTSLDIDHR